MSKPSPASDDGSAKSGKSMMTKLKIGGFILAVVVVEWLVAYMYLPGAAQSGHAADDAHDESPAEHASSDSHGGHGGHGGHGAAHGKGKEGGGSHSEQQEVDLGEYTVTGFQPVSNTTLFVSFHLYGTILHKNSEDFAKRLEDNKHRVRDNIIVIVRSAEIPDLTDAGLGLIKRRILETTNKTLGKPLVQGVIFSEFSFVEQ
jgi:flagellar basal body-associated protein FliL